jgi:hypothetical protein
MDVDDAEEYTQALGQVVAGGWRQIALGERLGVPDALGMTTREWVDQRLGGYIRLSISERREAVAELTGGEEPMTQRDVAAVLGVGKSTIADDVAQNRAADEPDTASDHEDEPPPARKWAEPLEDRIARLDDDLAKRVRGGLSIDEAELVQAQNEQRVDEWAARIRAGLDVLGRMAGHPVPDGIHRRLADHEADQLTAVLHVLEPFKEGVAA